MNEQIKNLLDKATIKDHWSVDENRYLTHFVDQEKFAELIVRECLEQCIKVEDDDKLSNYEGGFRDGALLCYQEIKQHFGVTE